MPESGTRKISAYQRDSCLLSVQTHWEAGYGQGISNLPLPNPEARLATLWTFGVTSLGDPYAPVTGVYTHGSNHSQLIHGEPVLMVLGP